jgi:hypothetical protein
MTDVRNIVISYLDAVYGGQVTTARRYMADQFSFTGPAAQFSNPDRYLRAAEHAARAVRNVEKHKIFVDGSATRTHAAHTLSLLKRRHEEGALDHLG